MLTPMGSLFAELSRRASANARREVETYAREIPELGSLDTSPRIRDETMEYSLWLRRRTVELAPDNGMLTDDDLGYIASMGEARAGAGMSLDARQQVLRVHTELMLREINEATEARRGGDLDELMRIMGWFAPQGERGIGAYRQGFVKVLRRRMPYVEQVALLARALLSENAAAAELAQVTDMELAASYTVLVIRVPDRPAGGRELESEIEALVKTHQVPVTWYPERDARGRDGGRGGGGELIALVPDPTPEAVPDLVPPLEPELTPAPAPNLVPDLLRDFAEALGRPCAAGTATAPVTGLAGAFDRARRISRAAPVRRASARLRPHTLADVFVELAVADVPFVDAWLRATARRLEPGPDLIVTLDAYYRHDMNRGPAAAALTIHPRTLDYRLRRVRELTDIDPGSAQGVRVFSAVVTRSLSGAWR
ncbi:helix-turn-helix domain-containing protein [Streptomyces lacrimifluminis]|uniref:Transcriptional regulator n=1 Tax=Streptomyces lacrimifluminis TaxID=1500077 RepID=A0A917UJ42_9ACTN|nr:PucR family transcriptional regulator [Streptomyces lacrimifluminis]GGJ61735.1 putative transcriptional regulator [Streptomyces lacrimifluminis]